jgi:integrase
LARKSLTAASVERIKPPPIGQTEHFDRGFPGLALRISYGGSKTFVFFYRIGGRLRRMTLGTYPAMSLADAREAWRKARQDVVRGQDPSVRRILDTGTTDFANVVQEWLKKDQAGKRSYRAVQRIVNKELMPHWQYRRVDEIGPREVLDLIDGIADRGKTTMARRVQAYIHRFFKWAKGRHIITVNPAADLPKRGSEVRRDRVLSNDELIKVWCATDELGWPYGAAIKLLILTGARREEIGQLRWSEIEGDTIRLKGERTKTAQSHEIPLSGPAQSVISEAPKIAQSEFVFTNNGRVAIANWGRVKIRLDELVQIPPWRIHDLRRTVSTGMNELGTEPYIVEAVLGHTVKGVAGVYNRAKYEAAKRAALEAWGVHVMDLVEPGRVP